MVKILTSPNGSPSKDWLKMVSSAKTRAKIRSYFKQAEKANRDEKIERGWKLIERELRKRSLNNVKREDFGNIDEQLLAVGDGAIGPGEAAQKLSLSYLQHGAASHTPVIPEAPAPAVRRRDGKSDILVEGEGGVSVVLAGCCTPVPGDEIVGYSSEKRGITVHRADCRSVKGGKNDRRVNVSWAEHNDDEGNPNRRGGLYQARLKVEGVDREELLTDATRALSLEGANIMGMKASVVGNSLVRMKIELKVRNLEHLYSAMAKLNEVRGIIEVTRG